jgi:hypothetical protein
VLTGIDPVRLNLGYWIAAGGCSARVAAALIVGWWRGTAQLNTAARLGGLGEAEAARQAARGGGWPANSSEFTVSVLVSGRRGGGEVKETPVKMKAKPTGRGGGRR